MATARRIGVVVLAATAAAASDGSSGAIDARDDSVDAPIADARPDGMSDSLTEEPPHSDLRDGTIAVIDLRVTNDLSATPDLEEDLAGASITVEYLDLTTATVGPAYGNPSLSFGECHVFVYDARDNGPPDRVDEGDVTIDGTVYDEAITCTFDGDAYRCALPSGDPVAGGGAALDFLDDGTAELTISKTEGAIVPAFTSTIHASGEGLALAPSSGVPHAFPATADADWTLSCAGANGDAAPGGDCGPNGGIAVSLALRGRTTDGDLATGCGGGACSAVAMPPPVAQWAEFRCRGEVGADDITLPAGAIAAILGTSPRRVETRLVRVTPDLTSDSTRVTAIAAGHGLVGYTDL